jgi:hypothetical protein
VRFVPPSRRHESLAGLFRSRPELAGEVLDWWQLPLPAYQQVRLASGQFTIEVSERWADAVLTFHDEDGLAVLAVVVEVQLSENSKKFASWPLYVHALHARLGCPVVLLVVCPDPKVAAWAARTMDAGFELVTARALVLGPDVVPVLTDPDAVGQHPELAVLSAITHVGHPEHDQIVQALVDGLSKIEHARAAGYAGIVLEVMPTAGRAYLERLMATPTYEYQSDLLRRWIAEGEAKGEAKGRAEALLAILSTRGIRVPDNIHTRITACADLDQLDTWIRQAITATTSHDLFD